MKPNPYIRPLALQFTRILRKWHSAAGWRTVVERNAAETNPSICHSHDFCDANQAMIDAFAIIHGREPNLTTDTDEINAAWAEAKASWQIKP